MQIVEILAPVFLVVVLGAVLRRLSVVPEEFGPQANRLVYWVALPVLLFRKLSAPGEAAEGAFALSAVMASGTVAAIAAAYCVALLLGLPKRSVGSFVQASFRGNLAYVGLPVVMLSLDNTHGSPPAAAAVVALGPVVVLYNIAAILVLKLGAGQGSGAGSASIVRQIVTNPLIVAIAAGLCWSRIGPATPVFMARTLDLIAAVALPLALLGVGGSLADTRLSGRIAPSVWSASIKLVVAPAAGWATGHAIGMEPRALQVAVLFLACPTAVASYVLAEQLGGDAELTGGTVVVSTILSAAALAAALVLL